MSTNTSVFYGVAVYATDIKPDFTADDEFDFGQHLKDEGLQIKESGYPDDNVWLVGHFVEATGLEYIDGQTHLVTQVFGEAAVANLNAVLDRLGYNLQAFPVLGWYVSY